VLLARAMLLIAALGLHAAAADDDFTNTAVIYVRGTSLIKADGKGRNETEIATLAAQGSVRALRTDALGKILLADVDGTWWWMPLDGSTKTLAQLPCEPGPAQISEDGRYVFCRKGQGSLVVNLVTGKLTTLAVPTLGARLLGDSGNQRKLVWADNGALWTSIAPMLDKPTVAAKEAPLRNLLISPDGTRALGVYASEVYKSAKVKQPGEVLMIYALDGEGARRKVIQNGVPVEWSHDSKWVLLQDGNRACIMLAAGGQYKCWRGFTAVSISPDGRYALILGNRSTGDDKKKDKKKKSKKADDDENPEAGDGEHGEAELPTDDIPVPPPTGPRSLYRAQVEGAMTKSPALIGRVVDGAAVWLPTPAAR
jgi:hypothetical protein